MEEWVPLYVALVGAIAAIGVAFWNSRGDFAELRQLKALNDLLADMPPSDEKALLMGSRDGLVLRVAARISSAPARRRLVWTIVGAVICLAIAVALLFLLAPVLPGWLSSGDISALAALIVAVASAGVAMIGARSSRKSEPDISGKTS